MNHYMPLYELKCFCPFSSLPLFKRIKRERAKKIKVQYTYKKVGDYDSLLKDYEKKLKNNPLVILYLLYNSMKPILYNISN